VNFPVLLCLPLMKLFLLTSKVGWKNCTCEFDKGVPHIALEYAVVYIGSLFYLTALGCQLTVVL
jgi:hypothetical protein